jgi:hypothetical protein
MIYGEFHGKDELLENWVIIHSMSFSQKDDKDVAEYLSQKGQQMDALTGKDCLILAFENLQIGARDRRINGSDG